MVPADSMSAGMQTSSSLAIRNLYMGCMLEFSYFQRKNHAVIKSPQPETGPSAEFISDKTRSSIITSSLMKTSYHARSCEFCTCHINQERDLNTALLAGCPSSYPSLTFFKQHHTQSACPALRGAQAQLC